MKVLLLRPQIEAGGASRVIIQLAQGLRYYGVEVEIATSGGEWLPKLQRFAICHYLPLYPSNLRNLMLSLWGLHKLIASSNYQLLNPHHRFASMVCNLATIGKQLPMISSVHEIKTDQAIWSRLAFAPQAIVFSQAVKQNLIMYHGLSEEHIFSIKMGVDVSQPTEDQLTRVRQDFSLRRDVPVVSCITRLSEEKGCHIFLEAASMVITKGYNAKFLIVGDGPQKNELVQKARKLSLDPFLHFTGWRDDVSAIVASSDFLVLPSLSEGVGITIIEGMALAKPTIGSRIGGIPEVIRDFETGLLVPPGDFNYLAESMITLINDPVFCSKLGSAGQQRCKEEFSLQRMLKQTSEVFDSLL
jgi:glycosyltransferase involved in cell wall biosynthesis